MLMQTARGRIKDGVKHCYDNDGSLTVIAINRREQKQGKKETQFYF